MLPSIKYTFYILSIIKLLIIAPCYAKSLASDTIFMDITDGIGPRGNTTISMLKVEEADSLMGTLLDLYDIASYSDITEKKEYYFILDDFQFYYQNHKLGKISKTTFLNLANERGWMLKDTILLSEKPLSKVIRMLVGKRKNEENQIYILDSNQNGTYTDDIVKPIPKITSVINEMIPPSSVIVDLPSKGEIKKSTIKVSPSIGHLGGISLSFKSLYFKRFLYGDQKYIVCREIFGRLGVFIIPDMPHFSPIPRNSILKDGEKLTLGDETVTLRLNPFDNYIILFPSHHSNKN